MVDQRAGHNGLRFSQDYLDTGSQTSLLQSVWSLALVGVDLVEQPVSKWRHQQGCHADENQS